MPPTFSPRERFWMVISFVLAIMLLFGGRGLPSVSARENDAPGIYENLKIFSHVLAIVQRDYVDIVEGKQLVEGAIKGLLSTLDPHSGYLSPEFYQDLQVQTKGEFGGLGIEITIKDGLLVVVAPMAGSPAEKAGIKAGDAIVKIEGKFTKQFSLVDAVQKLRGPKGTPINISIHRDGVPDFIDVTVIRDTITVRSVKHRYLGDGFAYVRISQFMESTADDLEKSLKELRKKSKSHRIKGMILDMRNNPGGLLTQAIRVSDLFLREGVIVYTDGRVEKQKQKFFAHERGTEPEYPIIALVNGGSASASEIVAGALKDHGRALVLGTQTFGKGSVQTITPLENGGALTLTTALYYTKSGNSIQAKGVAPDITVEVISEEEYAREKKRRLRPRERDLPGAIENPSGAKDGADALRELNKIPVVQGDLSQIDPATVKLSKWFEIDPQLARAFDLLKTFNIFRSGTFNEELLDETIESMSEQSVQKSIIEAGVAS